MTKALVDREIKQTIQRWANCYDLTETECDLLFLATIAEIDYAEMAETRGVERATIKKQGYTVLRKVGTSSISGTAVLILRQTMGDMSAKPSRPPRPLPLKGRDWPNKMKQKRRAA